MKKVLYFAILIMCVFFSECKKEHRPDVFRITEVDVTASYTYAEIKGTYSFSYEPKDMKVIYGEKNDLTDALSFDVNVEG